MSDYSELKKLAEASIQAWDQHFNADSHEFYAAWCAAEEAFSMAAREEAVLALIAESEALRKDAERYRRMRTAALKQADVLADEFDAEFDLQLDAAIGKEAQS